MGLDCESRGLKVSPEDSDLSTSTPLAAKIPLQSRLL